MGERRRDEAGAFRTGSRELEEQREGERVDWNVSAWKLLNLRVTLFSLGPPLAAHLNGQW